MRDQGDAEDKEAESHRPKCLRNGRLPLLIAVLTACFALPFLTGASPQANPASLPQAPAPTTPAQQPAATQKALEKVGNDTCLACHDIGAQFSRNPHAKTDCESCHGLGSQHAEEGTGLALSFRNKTAAWINKQCQACHGTQPQLAGFRRSPHGRNTSSCVSCHQVHSDQPVFSLLKGPEKELCSSCHPVVRAEFRKPYHHPVMEGAVNCSDCHNPHQEERRPLRRLVHGGEEPCVSCHSDKRGPFVFEHAPVKTNGCESCHQPHGSMNPKMLVRNQVHQLCVECHSLTPVVAGRQPPAFHDLRSPRFRNCTTCHREIHGSNASPIFEK